MVRKEVLSDVEKQDAVNLTETAPNSDEFDLSVLKVDIENKEKEIKELRNKELIERANLQKPSEIEPDFTESFQDFNEFLREVFEFILTFPNKPLKKIGITPFDEEFVEKLVKKLLDILPKDLATKIRESINVSGKTKKGIKAIKIFKFMTFITKELNKRYDEYKVYKDMEKVDKGAE